MKKVLILFTLIVSIFSHSKAQELDIRNQTLSWNVVSVKMKSDGETVSTKSEVILYGNEKIEWVQPDASRTYTFAILSTSGTWSDAASDGTIKYEAQLGDSKGTIIFQREGDVISIDFDFRKGEKTTFPFTLFIDAVAKK